MRTKIHSVFIVLLLLVLTSCAGFNRAWQSGCATAIGSDWVIVQFDNTGHPFRCWKLEDTSVANEPQSDGIYWEDLSTGNLVHISGNYNRVQVVREDWGGAFESVGLSDDSCKKLSHNQFVIP